LAWRSHFSSHFLRAPPRSRQKLFPLRQKKPAFAEKIHINGVKDAGKLNDHLYRGTQPNQNGLKELQKRGITKIVDLRGESRHESETEKKRAEELGMKFPR
jgi:hypothetical protein